MIAVGAPSARVPSKSVDVDQGTAPLTHSVVIQFAVSGKHVESSMQWPGCQTLGK